MLWILPWFRPSIQKRTDLDRQERFRAPAPSAHTVRRHSRKSPSDAEGHGCRRTAPGRAYTFARLGMSVTCLVILKVRLIAANYRQTCARCKRMKNKGLATKFCGDPLDNIQRDAKLSPISFPAAVVGEAARGEGRFLSRARNHEKTGQLITT